MKDLGLFAALYGNHNFKLSDLLSTICHSLPHQNWSFSIAKENFSLPKSYLFPIWGKFEKGLWIVETTLVSGASDLNMKTFLELMPVSWKGENDLEKFEMPEEN